MRRFMVSYLTASAIIILLVNLILIIFYVRQFSLQAQAVADCQFNACLSGNTLTDFIAINSILIGLLLVIWFVVIKLFHHPSEL